MLCVESSSEPATAAAAADESGDNDGGPSGPICGDGERTAPDAAPSNVSKERHNLDDSALSEALLHKMEAKEQAGSASAGASAGAAAASSAHSQQSTTQFDVKIGDGMDIAIHGENGKDPASMGCKP